MSVVPDHPPLDQPDKNSGPDSSTLLMIQSVLLNFSFDEKQEAALIAVRDPSVWRDKGHHFPRLLLLGEAAIKSAVSFAFREGCKDLDDAKLSKLCSRVTNREAIEHVAVSIGLEPIVNSPANASTVRKKEYTGESFIALMGAASLEEPTMAHCTIIQLFASQIRAARSR